MSRRILVLALALASLAAACGGSDTATAARLESVDAAGFAERIAEAPADLVILDVRTADEFNAGHIPGAVNVDYYAADFRQQLDALDKDAPYAMYCRSGNRSGDTLGIMEDLGFTDVSELDRGIVSWAEAGYSIE